jgi:hypothetical protein
MRRQHDARGVDPGLGLPDDDDRVRRFLEREAVGSAELGGIGKGRIAGEQLEGRAKPGEYAVEPSTITVILHALTVPDRAFAQRAPEQKMTFEQLDFIYTPSDDVASDMRYFTDVLGGRLIFAIDAMGIKVAMVELGEGSPKVLLAGHLEGERPILVYRVNQLAEAMAALESRGWTREGTFEIPQGPCCSFHAPGGHRIAIYELRRPEVIAHFAGRRDFG